MRGYLNIIIIIILIINLKVSTRNNGPATIVVYCFLTTSEIVENTLIINVNNFRHNYYFTVKCVILYCNKTGNEHTYYTLVGTNKTESVYNRCMYIIYIYIIYEINKNA